MPLPSPPPNAPVGVHWVVFLLLLVVCTAGITYTVIKTIFIEPLDKKVIELEKEKDSKLSSSYEGNDEGTLSWQPVEGSCAKVAYSKSYNKLEQ